MRRILIIGASIIVLLGAGLAVYSYFFANKVGLTVAPGATLPGVADTIAPIAGASGVGVNPATSAVTRVTERLVKISVGPVVPGEMVLDIPAKDASSTADVAVHYIEQTSGNIFAYFSRAGTLTRTSNKTLPGIQEAAWLPSGQTAFVRYLSGDTLASIETYGLAADGSSGFFLPQGLVGISVASTSVLTLASGAAGSVASLVKSDGTHATQAFSSPLSSLRISFAGKGGYLAFTKPAGSLPGHLFSAAGGGVFTRIAGPLQGLVALASPSGAWALVSYSSTGAMHMELVETKTGRVVPLPVATIADKCVWAADDSALYCGIPLAPSSEYSYPDDWYQGAAHFSDRIWQIDVAGRFAQLVLDFSAASGGALDAEALALDPLTTILVFVNKNDGSLWSYAL